MGDVELGKLQHSRLEGDTRQQTELASGDRNGVLHVVDVELGRHRVAALVVQRGRR